ncbi:hypothetical protein [Rhizobium mongolense]|uniref:Rop-like protein n=2 Tax=Rhizobium mongolense TaxID=57676 RepID=A0ABR6IEK9_9HYPH|nr:hypothetical protein [Rhizobium mongolense]MBB4226190.1 hypothetical protein [Rhizobium mongolense]TVZ73488.1 hypothetical protein BCL32_1720 [Rhizobium mongolense USDA 1844]
MPSLEVLKGKRHICQFYVEKAEARAAKATEDCDLLADLLGSLSSIIREDIQILDQEYEENN